MFASRRRLRTLAGWAWLAIAGIAFAPTVSRLTLAGPGSFGAGDGAAAAMHAAMSMAGVPSMIGAASMVGAADPAMHVHHGAHPGAPALGDLPSLPHSHTLDHCALCAVAAAAFVFTPSAPSLAPASDDGLAPVPIEARPVRHAAEWRPASSRGPPAA
jgi:hypothetical protein